MIRISGTDLRVFRFDQHPFAFRTDPQMIRADPHFRLARDKETCPGLVMVIMVYIPANYENIYLTNGATDAWYQSIMIFECNNYEAVF